LTIVGKVQYIIDRYKIAPEEILLISFTKGSTNDLEKRIMINGLKPKTFHKFSKDVIYQVEGTSPNIFGDVKDEINQTTELKELLKKFFTELKKDENYLFKVVNYFDEFLKPYRSQFEFQTKGDYIQYLKDYNIRPYKTLPGRTTYNREIVKSIEECKIANFLLFNRIDYCYEKPFEFDVREGEFAQYKPDFTIEQNGKRIYLEHFGISRKGDVPTWFETKNGLSLKEYYELGMNRKNETHKKYRTIIFETYHYEMEEGILFINLKEKLEKLGISFNPLSEKEKLEIMEKSAEDEFKKTIE